MLIGFVGKPNAGKSTFFRAASLAPAEISPRPFTTIKPNHGVGYIRTKCPCDGKGCNPRTGMCINGTRFVPVELLDVAGLVPGASEGRGLGNQFLDDLRRADAIVHVVDSSGTTDNEGKPGRGDPVNDTVWLVREFELWLQDVVSRSYTTQGKKTDEELHNRLAGMGIPESEIKNLIEKQGLPSPRNVAEYAHRVRELKPIIIVANKADLPESRAWLDKLRALGAVPASAENELALKLAEKSKLITYVPGDSDFQINGSLSPSQTGALDKIREFLRAFKTTGVQEALEKAIHTLELIVVYPVEDENKWSDKQGRVLPDAYIVPKTTTPRELAYRIHTDIGENFVAAIDARKKMKLAADKPLFDGAIVKIQARR